MMLQNLHSQLLLVFQDSKKLDQNKKLKSSLVKMLSLKNQSVHFIIQLKTVSLKTGNLWRKSGITVTSTNSEEKLQIKLLCSLKLQETLLTTEKECAKFSSTNSKSHNSTFKSKLFSPSTLQEEPLVVLLMSEMVLLTLSQFTKVIPFLILSKDKILLVEPSLDIWLISYPKLVNNSNLLLKWMSLEISKKNSVGAP